jgi:hypothetical protein
MRGLAVARLPANPLSKTRFQTGLQCLRALHLSVPTRDLADPLSPATLARFAVGHRVGELATGRYPGGVLIEDDHLHHGDAVRATADALAHGAPAVFEAAFAFGGVKVRVDVLERLDDGSYALVEVKSTASAKDEHVTDAAVQTYVLRGSGVDVSRVSVMHLDKGYVWEGGDYDVDRLFVERDVTAAVEAFLPQIPALVLEMVDVLSGDLPEEPDDVECGKPYTCRFVGYCASLRPVRTHPPSELPHASARLRAVLDAADIQEIADIPDDVSLTRCQELTKRAVREGSLIVEEDGVDVLRSLDYPVHFLDFETLGPALPVYVGTRPFQTIPFQWSDHVLHSDGTIEHREFLAAGRDDPREEFTRTLLDALVDAGSIVHYSAYERTQLARLRRRYPEHEDDFARIESRLFDLLPVVRNHCFHPDFRGSSSMKAILPVLTELDYAALDVCDGLTAQAAYEESLAEGTPVERRHEIVAALGAYCAIDTEGMLAVYRAMLDAR